MVGIWKTRFILESPVLENNFRKGDISLKIGSPKKERILSQPKHTVRFRECKC